MSHVAPPIEIETGPNPVATIVFMHGLGADASDFVPFAQEIDLQPVGPVRWLFPNAPLQPVTLNGGYVMPAWFDIRHDRSDEDEAGLRRSHAAIKALLAREQARGIPAGRIVLGGFSQGCAMALLAGVRHAERLAGIVGLSGYLPLAARTAAERSAANAATPILLAHGRQDPMVAIERAQAARATLRQLGYPLQWHDYAMPHCVCAEEVADLQHWLRGVLGAAP